MKFSDINLMIATPVYGGSLSIDYVSSLLNTIIEFQNQKINVFVEFAEDFSLVMDARNMLVERFLASDGTHILFVDADISFEPEDIIELIKYCNEDKKILSGHYPIKKENWKSIEKKIKESTPTNLLKYYFGTPMIPLNETGYQKNIPVKVSSTGAGFLLIAKEVFVKLKTSYSEYTYYEKNENKIIEKFAYFDTRIVKNDTGLNIHIGEDISFCHLCNQIGIDIWILPWIHLGHTGRMCFYHK